jgi:hypothetical protein
MIRSKQVNLTKSSTQKRREFLLASFLFCAPTVGTLDGLAIAQIIPTNANDTSLNDPTLARANPHQTIQRIAAGLGLQTRSRTVGEPREIAPAVRNRVGLPLPTPAQLPLEGAVRPAAFDGNSSGESVGIAFQVDNPSSLPDLNLPTPPIDAPTENAADDSALEVPPPVTINLQGSSVRPPVARLSLPVESVATEVDPPETETLAPTVLIRPKEFTPPITRRIPSLPGRAIGLVASQEPKPESNMDLSQVETPAFRLSLQIKSDTVEKSSETFEETSSDSKDQGLSLTTGSRQPRIVKVQSLPHQAPGKVPTRNTPSRSAEIFRVSASANFTEQTNQTVDSQRTSESTEGASQSAAASVAFSDTEQPMQAASSSERLPTSKPDSNSAAQSFQLTYTPEPVGNREAVEAAGTFGVVIENGLSHDGTPQPNIRIDDFESTSTNGVQITANVRVPTNGTQLVKLPGKILRIESSDESICRFVQIGDGDFSIVGSQLGNALLSVWVQEPTTGDVKPIGLSVAVHRPWQTTLSTDSDYTQQLTDMLTQLYPDCEFEIRAAENGSLTVEGNAPNESTARKVLGLVRKICLVPVHDHVIVERR